MRTGAGLVTLGIPESINSAVIKIKPKEVMTLPLPETREGNLSNKGYAQIKKFIEKRADVLAIGPGLGQNKSTKHLVIDILIQIAKPMVMDADALNILSLDLNALRLIDALNETEKIITPHPGEMAKLLRTNVNVVQKNRENFARDFSKKYNLIVVLKGHNTIVADYHGNLYINKTGNPGMATAGSGDVLTGMIAAFVGQGLSAFQAAKYAVYLHGLAGDLAAKEKTQIGMLASDIIEKIPEAIKISS